MSHRSHMSHLSVAATPCLRFGLQTRAYSFAKGLRLLLNGDLQRHGLAIADNGHLRGLIQRQRHYHGLKHSAVADGAVIDGGNHVFLLQARFGRRRVVVDIGHDHAAGFLQADRGRLFQGQVQRACQCPDNRGEPRHRSPGP